MSKDHLKYEDINLMRILFWLLFLSKPFVDINYSLWRDKKIFCHLWPLFLDIIIKCYHFNDSYIYTIANTIAKNLFLYIKQNYDVYNIGVIMVITSALKVNRVHWRIKV